MDPKNNPFAPGAGTQPPELAGRSGIIADADIAIARAKSGRAKSALLLGLRGVGKTVLLNRIAENAQSEGCEAIFLEAPEDQPLAQMLAPPLRSALFRLSATEKAQVGAKKALGVLRSFASVFKAKVGEIEFGVKPESGVADSGNLEFDLPELLITVANAARQADTAIVLIVDEVQYLGSEDLSALIISLHKLGQKGLPFLLYGAGLPQLAGLAGNAKSYAERLFDYPDVGPLTDASAKDALREPLRRQGVDIHDDALAYIASKTQGYPYFLQEWGYQAWNTAASSPIGLSDVKLATKSALARLDTGFFKVRLDRLTPREKDYMGAMAALGAGPHRSGDIAAKLKLAVTAAAPLRNGLIKKGMIYSPQHGDTAFTVPMFDEFMQRVTGQAAKKR
jgi:hypothetical protein